MTRIDPYILIALQTAGFSEDELSKVFDVDRRTVNDYLDCYNLGFDCALLHIGNRLEKAGIAEDVIDVVIGKQIYGSLRDTITDISCKNGKPITLEIYGDDCEELMKDISPFIAENE